MSNIEDDLYEIKKLKIFLIFYKTHGWIPNIDRTIDVEKSIQCIENILSDYTRQKQINEEHQKINGELREKVKELEGERKRVLDLIFEYGQIDGGHHKMWVIDQIVRILTKDKYNEWIKDYVYDEETGDIYSWDKGIAP